MKTHSPDMITIRIPTVVLSTIVITFFADRLKQREPDRGLVPEMTR